jgi:hypothetical protein
MSPLAGAALFLRKVCVSSTGGAPERNRRDAVSQPGGASRAAEGAVISRLRLRA